FIVQRPFFDGFGTDENFGRRRQSKSRPAIEPFANEGVIGSLVSQQSFGRGLHAPGIYRAGDLHAEISSEIEIAGNVVATHLQEVRNGRWQRKILDDSAAEALVFGCPQATSCLSLS